MKRHIQTFGKVIRAFLIVVVLISTTLVMSGCSGDQASSQGSNPPANPIDYHNSYDSHEHHDHHPLCIFNFGSCG
jgi:hypothetical protein